MDIPPLLTPTPAGPPAPVPVPPTKAGGCLKLLVALLILLNALSVVANVLGAGAQQLLPTEMASKIPTEPGWVTLSATIYSALAIIALFFVFRWKKWAVLAYVGLGIAMFVVLKAGGKSWGASLESLVGAVVLVGLLRIGGQNSAWKRLK